MFKNLFYSYKQLPKNVHSLILLELSTNLIHVAFILILNIFLRKKGFNDPEIASFNSLRFIGALIFALPLGIYIRNKNLKPFLLIGSVIIPSSSILIIESIHRMFIPFIQFSFLLWGIGMMLVRVCSLPFIIRNTNPNNSSEALSLSASTWSFSTVISGLIIGVLDWVGTIYIGNLSMVITERSILWLITILGSCAFFAACNIKEDNKPNAEIRIGFFSMNNSYDWNRILKAISPLILISVGAGLTIPFINLFFNSIFGLTASQFSIMGSASAILVFVFSLLVPYLGKKYGYWLTIIIVQLLSILCLITMAMMELYSRLPFAFTVAVLAYIFRQPLMHMAHPASNELMMSYVGKKNQELISALSSSLWSASWFFSAKVFEWMRLANFRYVEIFIITAILYILGVVFYAFLIMEHKKIGEINQENILQYSK
tara:strand:+ start:79654 stop:80943 length:1290 start_codon:yes stop_codon:yes gene_type:complete